MNFINQNPKAVTSAIILILGVVARFVWGYELSPELQTALEVILLAIGGLVFKWSVLTKDEREKINNL